MLFALLLSACSKDDVKRNYQDIDMAEFSTQLGKSANEIQSNYSQFLIEEDQGEIILLSKFDFETMAGNYTLEVFYEGKFVKGEDAETKAVLFRGKLKDDKTRSDLVQHLEKLLEYNFNEEPDNVYLNPIYGETGTPTPFENLDEVIKDMKGNELNYKLEWIRGEVTYTITIADNILYYGVGALREPEM